MSDTPPILTLAVEDGALTEAACWESHKRGKNWCAVIAKDPRSPGGLSRDFWERGLGEYYYILPPAVARYSPMEWGADYYTGNGKPRRYRKYSVLIDVHEDKIVLEMHDTAAQAIKRAKELESSQVESGEEPVELDAELLGHIGMCIRMKLKADQRSQKKRPGNEGCERRIALSEKARRWQKQQERRLGTTEKATEP
jgi:hypothetical protein